MRMMGSMRSLLRSCVFALTALVVVGSSVRADVAGSARQLGALAGHQQTAPAVSGSGVVWTDFNGSQFDIYFQDVSTGNGPVNLTGAVAGNDFLEDIDKSNVVFTHTGGPNNAAGDILMIDSSTSNVTNIASSNSTVHFAHPAIRGNYVVFERITTQYDVDVYDLTLGGSPGPQVTNGGGMHLHPRVSGDLIVYEDYSRNGPNGAPDVYGYHVSTSGPSFLIAQNGRLPDVDGNSVVFVGSDASGGPQIFRYDLVAGTTKQLTTATSSKSTPRISGTRIVWTDNRLGTDDVWLRDLSTGVEDLLAGGPGSQQVGGISDSRVVYSSTDASGNTTVWLFTIATPPPDPLPPGCDPAKTNLVDGPVTLSEPTRRPVYAHHKFSAPATGKTYYLCVDNGKPDGSQRSAHVIAAVDGDVLLRPADFKPAANPPRHVAVAIDFDHERGDDDDDCADDDRQMMGGAHAAKGMLTMWQFGHEREEHHGCGAHHWDAVLFAQPSTTIAVSIRVAK